MIAGLTVSTVDPVWRGLLMEGESKVSDEPIPWPVPVLRVGLRWEGEKWTTTDLIRVPAMTLPSGDQGDPKEHSGFWVDTIDDQGRLRYRQRMTDPLLGMEQFSENGEMVRLSHGQHVADIEVLVPDDVPAAVVRLVRRTERDKTPQSVELPVDRGHIRSYDDQSPSGEGHRERGDHRHDS